MVHSDSGWTRGVQVKMWDPLRTRAIPECLRGVIAIQMHVYVYLYNNLDKWYAHTIDVFCCSRVWCWYGLLYAAVCVRVVSTIVTWQITSAAHQHPNIAVAAAALTTDTTITALNDDSDDDDDANSTLNSQLTRTKHRSRRNVISRQWIVKTRCWIETIGRP